MSGSELVYISFGFMRIMEQMLDHHLFCELDIFDFALV